MSNLVSIEPAKTDVKEVLEDALKWSEGMKCIMIIGIDRDGGQVLRTSTISGYEKAFMICFLNAWMADWFSLADG